MPKNVFMLSVSFTGSYIEDEPNFPPRNNLISQKIVWRKQGTEFQGTFQDLIKKSLQVFFKDFSRRLLKFQTFSRLYEPWARFSKVPLTFRARNQIFKSKYKE